MNEPLIRRAVAFKLSAAGRLLDHLPAGTSASVRRLGELLYDCLGEHLKTGAAAPPAKAPGIINKVEID